LLLARTTNVLLSASLAGLADAIHSASDGFFSLGAQSANLPTDSRPDRHHTGGQRTGVKPTDLATAHQISDQVVQRLDAHCGPLRCAVHLEPHDPASTLLLIPGAGDG
jgi:divalent metal cation (Fe/Co/Zn/Cd) transporter